MLEPTDAMKHSEEYKEEITNIGPCTSGILPVYLRLHLKKDSKYDVAADTGYLGVGAEETIFVHNSDTQIFKSMNGPLAEFGIDTSFVICSVALGGCVPRLMGNCKQGSAAIITDCGNNSTGLPVRVIDPTAGPDPGMKVPVTISGNWTPQIRRGHMKVPPEVAPTGFGVQAVTYVASSPCNPGGSMPGNSNISPTASHILSIATLKAAFCTNNMTPKYFYNLAGNTIPSGSVSIYDGNQSGIIILDGAEPHCISQPGAFILRFDQYGNAEFKDIVSGIQFEYIRASDGAHVTFVATTQDIPGTLRISIDSQGTITVTDHSPSGVLAYCDRAHSPWYYDPYLTIGTVFPGSVGTGASVQRSCGPAASIIGSALTASGSMTGIYDSYLNRTIPLAQDFDWNETGSFSISQSHNGISAGGSGTITCSHVCGGGNICNVTLSGSVTSGTVNYTDVTANINPCIGPILTAFNPGTTPIWTAWADILSIHLPVSNRFFKLQMRGKTTATATTDLFGTVYYGVAFDVNVQMVLAE